MVSQMAGILATTSLEGNDDSDAGTEVNTQANCLLLNQPVDIVFQILEHLPPESSVAFSLTCKAAYSGFFQRMKQGLDVTAKQNLLPFLEESLSKDFFFCHNCAKLHPLDPAWTRDPGSNPVHRPHLGPGGGQPQLPCKPRIHTPGGLGIGFHHIKLATNAHLWGSGHGMSLAWLKRDIPVLEDWKSTNLDSTHWKIGHDARISGDAQLFLRVTHKALVSGYAKISSCVNILPSRPHFICHHVANRASGGTSNLFLPLDLRYNNTRGSCDICLTDYTATVKRLGREDYPFGNKNAYGTVWEKTIISYHQLGRCRSPSDPAWVAFSQRRPTFSDGEGYGFTPRTAIPVLHKEPGAIKRQWDMLNPTGE